MLGQSPNPFLLGDQRSGSLAPASLILLVVSFVAFPPFPPKWQLANSFVEGHILETAPGQLLRDLPGLCRAGHPGLSCSR